MLPSLNIYCFRVNFNEIVIVIVNIYCFRVNFNEIVIVIVTSKAGAS